MDLRGQAAHFYELASRALDLFEEDEIVDVLTKVCPSLTMLMVCSAHQWLMVDMSRPSLQEQPILLIMLIILKEPLETESSF